MKKKIWEFVVPVLLVAVFVAWYAFRPERLFLNKYVDEKLPNTNNTSAPHSLESGTFHSVIPPIEGTATIYRTADGGRVIRFTNFKTSNGPDVHIYMVAAADATDNASVLRAGFIDLGSIKGNIGDQNYALPPDVDLSIPYGICLVQTLQRQFRSRAAHPRRSKSNTLREHRA